MSINESWIKVLRKMEKDELFLILYEHDDYSPEICTLAKDTLKQKYGVTEEEFLSIPETDHLIKGDAGSRKLLIEVLERIGCKKISFDNDDFEDDGSCTFTFSYQGESFYASAYNDNVYVCIEKFCGGFEDSEEIEKVKEAINQVNDSRCVTMYYLEDESYDTLYVDCRIDFLFIPLIPNLALYLCTQLRTILEAERFFSKILDDLKQ